jgi:hypothetical protein
MPLDILDDIVRAYLRDQVLALEKDISSLMSKENLETYDKQDLKDWIEYREGHLKVLEYLTENTEHRAWIKKHELGTYIIDF